MTQDQVNYIIDNKAIPYPTDEIKLIQTHISWVILTNQYAYKIKKPIEFSFLNFSTLEKRREYCEKEVKLNKRLAPAMYLEVLPIKKSNGKYRTLDNQGTIIDGRNRKGFVIDGHGDLHTRNIFLLDNPVIFDCLEFNDDFRKLDLLNEIAFLCMDLERFGRFDLSKIFSERYFSKIPCIENKTDEQIFCFYKLYRANVRLKVHALNAQADDITEDKRQREMALISQYLELYKQYYIDLKGT